MHSMFSIELLLERMYYNKETEEALREVNTEKRFKSVERNGFFSSGWIGFEENEHFVSVQAIKLWTNYFIFYVYTNPSSQYSCSYTIDPSTHHPLAGTLNCYIVSINIEYVLANRGISDSERCCHIAINALYPAMDLFGILLLWPFFAFISRLLVSVKRTLDSQFVHLLVNVPIAFQYYWLGYEISLTISWLWSDTYAINWLRLSLSPAARLGWAVLKHWRYMYCLLLPPVYHYIVCNADSWAA